jgi:hypothetical protein
MANQKLIEDLKRLERASIDWRDYSTEGMGKWVGDIASRALKEIEYLETELRWKDFKPGDMK